MARLPSVNENCPLTRRAFLDGLDCIKSRRQPSCSVFYHVHVDVPIALSLLSLKLGRSIRFDPTTERIVNDPEAARLAIPKHRAPWKLPEHYLHA